MFEIIMLFAFFYAATCQLLPTANRDDKPGLLRKNRIAGKARERTEESVTKQKVRHKKFARRSKRKPFLHLQHDRPGIVLNVKAKPC